MVNIKTIKYLFIINFLALSLNVYGALSINNVTPNSGSESGGYSIEISGLGFLSGANVTIGAESCLNTVVVSEEIINCTAPTNEVGPADIVVTNPDQESVTLISGFTYTLSQVPVVTLLTPNKGSELGGTNITIYGSNFQFDGEVDPYISLSNLTYLLNFEDNYNDRQGQHPATDNNSPSFNSESLAGNKSVYFPGTVDSRLSISPHPTDFDGDNITVSFWVKGDGDWEGDGSDNGTARGKAVLFSSNNGKIIISVSPSDGRINLTLDQDSLVGSRDIISDGEWHHLAFVIGKTNGSNSKLYIDGSLDTSITVSTNWSLANQGFYIADGPTTFYEEFKGFIDEFSFTNRALTDQEVLSLYDFGINPLGISVDIGGSYCLNVALPSDDQLTCNTSPHIPGVNNVVIKNDLGLTTTIDGGFTYLVDSVTSLPPILSNITPSSGTELGGTFITITGSGFKPNPTILINDVLCNQVVFISSSQVTCVTPVYSPGLYDVKITNSDNQSSILLNSYSYLENDFPPPTIESVVPNSGSESGGTLIQITGTGFRNGIAVTIGEAVCEVQSVQETTLSCQTNASDFGEENLIVTNIDNKSDILPNGYTYTQDNPPPIPIIYEINPSQGNIQGGETILIFGSGLFNGSEVYMGGARCEMTSFIDGNPVDLLYCKTPAHAKGISDVIIRNDRVKFSNILSFEFIDPNYQTPTPITPTPPPVLPPIEEKTEENNGFDPKTQKKSASPVTRPLQSCGETSAAIPSVSYIVYFLNYLIGLGISFLFRFKK